MTKQDFEVRFGSLGSCEAFEPAFSGVYFLCKDGGIVYVGQSKNIPVRLAEHRKRKTWDSAKIMRVPEPLLDLVEWYWMERLKPKLNTGPGLLRYRAAEAKEMYQRMVDEECRSKKQEPFDFATLGFEQEDLLIA
jgi:hypothetical protein